MTTISNTLFDDSLCRNVVVLLFIVTISITVFSEVDPVNTVLFTVRILEFIDKKQQTTTLPQK